MKYYYGLYEKEYPNICVGIFKLKELKKILGFTSESSIYKAVERKHVVRKKYKIEKIDINLDLQEEVALWTKD